MIGKGKQLCFVLLHTCEHTVRAFFFSLLLAFLFLGNLVNSPSRNASRISKNVKYQKFLCEFYKNRIKELPTATIYLDPINLYRKSHSLIVDRTIEQNNLQTNGKEI